MACPTKRVGSDNWFFRKRIPADVRAILTRSPDLRPPRWFKDHISISLGTPDRDTAKAKCPDVAAQVERQIAALRAPSEGCSASSMTPLATCHRFQQCSKACPLQKGERPVRGATKGEHDRDNGTPIMSLRVLNENVSEADQGILEMIL